MLLNLLSQRIYNPQIIEPIRNFTGWEYINRLIPILIALGFIISIIVTVILIIIGGIRWIMSGGNKDTIISARNTVTNGIVGLALLLSLYLIIQFINLIFGINIGGFGTPVITRIELRPPGPFSNLEGWQPESLITRAIFIVIMIAALVFFFMLIAGGIRWITSGGDKGALESARRQIRNAIIGLVIVLSSFLIIQEINCIFKVNLGNLGVPPWCGEFRREVQCANTDPTCSCLCGPGEIPDPSSSCDPLYPNCGNDTCLCIISPDERGLCEAGGGTWREDFPDECADFCLPVRPPVCSPAITPGCDCGVGKCWNLSSCVDDQSCEAMGGQCQVNPNCGFNGCGGPGDCLFPQTCCYVPCNNPTPTPPTPTLDPQSCEAMGGYCQANPNCGFNGCSGPGDCPGLQTCCHVPCNIPTPTPTIAPTPTPMGYCTDTDGGINYYVYGMCDSSIEHNQPDFCNGSIVQEGHCYAVSGWWHCVVDAYTCPGGCASGACL